MNPGSGVSSIVSADVGVGNAWMFPFIMEGPYL
jgi:hypothetical protein